MVIPGAIDRLGDVPARRAGQRRRLRHGYRNGYRPGNGSGPRARLGRRLPAAAPTSRAAASTTPEVLNEVKPQYTADAMRAKIQGTVMVECIVQPDGTVTDMQGRQVARPDVWPRPGGDQGGPTVAVPCRRATGAARSCPHQDRARLHASLTTAPASRHDLHHRRQPTRRSRSSTVAWAVLLAGLLPFMMFGEEPERDAVLGRRSTTPATCRSSAWWPSRSSVSSDRAARRSPRPGPGGRRLWRPSRLAGRPRRSRSSSLAATPRSGTSCATWRAQPRFSSCWRRWDGRAATAA